MEDYASQVNQAQAFLDGRSKDILNRLEAEMRGHSERKEYFSAARTRDRLLALRYLDDELDRIHNPVLHETVYAPQIGGKNYWFVIGQSMVRWVRRAPTTSLQAVIILRKFEQSPPSPYGVVGDRAMQRIVNGWFGQFPEERQQALTLNAAKSVCQELLVDKERVGSKAAQFE